MGPIDDPKNILLEFPTGKTFLCIEMYVDIIRMKIRNRYASQSLFVVYKNPTNIIHVRLFVSNYSMQMKIACAAVSFHTIYSTIH